MTIFVYNFSRLSQLIYSEIRMFVDLFVNRV